MHFGSPVALMAALLVAHCLCDYPLQGDFLARAKQHQRPVPGVPWYHALTAHAVIQAGAVWLVTGSPAIGACELVCHWCIDRTRCEGTITYDVDQLLHVVCKAAWVWILGAGLLA